MSMVRKGNESFLIRYDRSIVTGSGDHLTKAARTWSYTIESYLDNKNDKWTTVRYEDLIATPKGVVQRLFTFLGLDADGYIDACAALPVQSERNAYSVWRLYQKARNKDEIRGLLARGCELFGYDESIDLLHRSALNYWLDKVTTWR